jgi:hypothetical protein
MYDLTDFKNKLRAITGADVGSKTATYLLIRDELKKVDEAAEAAKKPLLDLKALLEGYFEKFLTSTGQQSAVTPRGTVHWNTRYTSSLGDPQAFMDHVIATQQFDLLDRRANATAVKEYAGKNGALPPGVNLNTIRTIGVRVPGAKAKGE